MDVDVGFFERWFYRDKLTNGVHLHFIAGIRKRYSIRTPFCYMEFVTGGRSVG